jgi:threonine dehydrogenase-like Zn-dependent dehydrogenase
MHASRGEGVDHVVDVCGAGTLEQSLKAVRDEGIISVVGFPYNLGRTVRI